MLDLFIDVPWRLIHLEVVELVIHHRDVTAAVPEGSFVLILLVNRLQVDCVLLLVLEEFLISSNSHRSKLVIVPLVRNLFDSIAAV